VIEKDTSRVRYLSPEEAVQYGLIDKVLYPEEFRVQVKDSSIITSSFLSLIAIMIFSHLGPQIHRVPVRGVAWERRFHLAFPADIHCL
jgi:hypothetical protein